MADGPCANELASATICVEGDAATCGTCLDVENFNRMFPDNAEIAFRSAVAFLPPQQKGFCDEANYRTCVPLLEDGDMVCYSCVDVIVVALL
jgi:hypothetical protein